MKSLKMMQELINKKVTYNIVIKVLKFIRLFEGCQNQNLLIDRLVVALMHK